MTKKIKSVEWSLEPPERPCSMSFINLHSGKARSLFEDHEPGPWYQVQWVEPVFVDAVVLLLYERIPANGIRVALRRGTRPVTALRTLHPRWADLDGRQFDGTLWELPAGGVEEDDLRPGGGGILGRASAEALEEAGLVIPPQAFRKLGSAPFSVPSFSTERLHYLAAPVNPEDARPPQGDGHPMEEGAFIRWLELREALLWCREGRIVDTKTELGLYRLAGFLG